MKSPKELSVDNKIIEAIESFNLSEKAVNIAKLVIKDAEIQAVQEYGNIVSIKRLGYNDHGPVHMRTVVLNALFMLKILRDANVKMSLECEEAGTFEDSTIAVLLAGFLHDIGMSVGRQDHGLHGAYMAYPILDRILAKEFSESDIQRRVTIRSLALEAIAGHMGNRSVYSLEAGIVLIADGCDMTKGRAHITMFLAGAPKVGDIHRYSANSIEDVRILKGEEHPIRIEVEMSSEVGLFQVEEVLLGKISASPAKGLVELYALVQGEQPKRYL
ncbi:MAG: HD domain-containing protein [Treponema sp.]|jgi:metal-dependent HD superfamily phosphatase/phosphodiesterase|nr:HD domain-containing protein [Treponema sp.]